MDEYTEKKLDRLEEEIDLMECDGSASSMHKMANIVKDLIHIMRNS